jgi:zinc protease
MNRSFLKNFIFLVFCSLQLTTAVEGQLLPSDSIPLNGSVRHGILKNGLKYYIFQSHSEGNAITLRLIQMAGKVHSKEMGVAHFIEHMSFRSTVDFVQGVRKFQRWSNIGGRTTDLTTEYTLSVQNNDSILFHYALLAIQNFCKGRLYLPDDVEGERSAILNESARRDTSAHREVYFLLDENPLYDNAHQAQREIRDTQVMSVESLREFDRKWYRPDRQGVVIVGNVDVNDVEKKVKVLFSGLTIETKIPLLDIAKEYDSAIAHYDVPLTKRDKLVVVKTNQPNTHVRILQKRKSSIGMDGPSTLSQMKIKFMDELYRELISLRLDRIRGGSNDVVIKLDHFVDRRMMDPIIGMDALTTSMNLKSVAGMRSATVRIFAELGRIERYGFTESEFAAVKERVSSRCRNSKLPTGSSILSALGSHFVHGTAFPENAAEVNMKAINAISLNDINTMAKTWIGEDGNTDVLVYVPKDNSIPIPREKDVFMWIKAGRETELPAYEEKVATLKSLPLPPVQISRRPIRSELNEFDATQVILSNGAKVVVKRMGPDSENPWPDLGDVMIYGFRKGGVDLYGDKDQASASIACKMILSSGIADLNASEFEDWLKNKRRNGELIVSPHISSSETSIEGTSNLNNVNDLFHLVYLYFTQPRRDKVAFTKIAASNTSKNRIQKPSQQLFEDSVQNVIKSAVPHNAKGIVRFDRAFRIYKEMFSNARDFTFVITGYFETDDIIKYAAKYLGALPAGTDSKKHITDENKIDSFLPVARNDDLRVTLIGDGVKNTDVRMLFTTKVDATVRNSLLIDINAKILRSILIERLREKEKGVYTANIAGGWREGSGEYILNVIFDTAPENVDRLTKAVIDEFNKIARGTLEERIFKNAIMATSLEISRDLMGYSYTNQYLVNQLRKGTVSSDGLRRAEILATLTKEDVISFFRDSLNRERYVLFKLL